MYTRLSGRGLYPRFLSDNTASDLVPGVDQIAPSTPGVHLPWFSVTRFTAKALPLSERMSKRCNAFALRRLPSCHAFTIRTCKLLTRRWQSDQLVSRQSKVGPERACARRRSSAQFSVEASQLFS
jgi:hypothetical protein